MLFLKRAVIIERGNIENFFKFHLFVLPECIFDEFFLDVLHENFLFFKKYLRKFAFLGNVGRVLFERGGCR